MVFFLEQYVWSVALDVQVAVEQASEMPLDLEKCKTAFGLFDDVPLDSES